MNDFSVTSCFLIGSFVLCKILRAVTIYRCDLLEFKMNSKLFEILKGATIDFSCKAKQEIQNKTYRIASPSNDKNVDVTATQLINALRIICPSNLTQLKNDVIQHFNEVRSYIPFCSSPKSFRTAWDLRSELLNHWDANTIVDQGGQLLPINKSSRLLQCIQQGVELGTNKRLILAVRHSEGNYEDKMDDLGRFTYQPPNSTTGMLRYRWCHFLGNSMQIPYVLLAIMWFEANNPINNDLKHVFMVAPAKIIDSEENLVNLGNSLNKPLEVQIINRMEALSVLNLISSLSETDLEIETRFELPEQLAREWSYDKINNTPKGRKIKKWAQNTGKKCPGQLCNKGTHPNIEFKDLRMSEIAFGHLIPQNWAKAYSFMLDKVNHPDNLYLTCNSCNSSLSDSFPDKTFRDKIVQSGTIGDWLRKNEVEIRKS